MHISELALHPLKSAARQQTDLIRLDAQGPLHDRRWMLVDASGRFVTQRTHPRLCLLSARVDDEGVLCLSAPGAAPLRAVPEAPVTLAVSVWEDGVDAVTVSAAADAWCSAFLGMAVRLVHMPAAGRREVDTAWAGPGHFTAFSDGFPLLVVTQSSLDALNALLSAPVDWRRFRPNVVIAGDVPPHAEDGWQRLRIGQGAQAVELALVKPCSRCVIPSIDPDTAAKNSQILTVLRGYRARADGRTYVGQNAIVLKAGEGACLRQGDPVEVLA
ncbi:MAG: MOSC domain-containing protein [Moraxellaceae bacterium]|nr:MOSC domain-containing protein [Moraxellaceae bacterium]